MVAGIIHVDNRKQNKYPVNLQNIFVGKGTKYVLNK